MNQRARRGEKSLANEVIRPEVHRAVHQRDEGNETPDTAAEPSAAGRALGLARRGFWAVMIILAVSASAFYLQVLLGE